MPILFYKKTVTFTRADTVLLPHVPFSLISHLLNFNRFLGFYTPTSFLLVKWIITTLSTNARLQVIITCYQRVHILATRLFFYPMSSFVLTLSSPGRLGAERWYARFELVF